MQWLHYQLLITQGEKLIGYKKIGYVEMVLSLFEISLEMILYNIAKTNMMPLDFDSRVWEVV